MLDEVQQEFDKVFHRLELLEAGAKRFEKYFVREKGAPVMDLGMCYFMEGDAIPSRGSAAEFLEGKVWLVGNTLVKFVKNDSGKYLMKGDDFKGGKIDSNLRSESVAPNNFCYVEI